MMSGWPHFELNSPPLDLRAQFADDGVERRQFGRVTMRSFLAACCVSLAIAVMAAVILDFAFQESATRAFSTSEVRN
jgi:hypothetical protein